MEKTNSKIRHFDFAIYCLHLFVNTKTVKIKYIN